MEKRKKNIKGHQWVPFKLNESLFVEQVKVEQETSLSQVKNALVFCLFFVIVVKMM